MTECVLLGYKYGQRHFEMCTSMHACMLYECTVCTQCAVTIFDRCYVMCACGYVMLMDIECLKRRAEF